MPSSKRLGLIDGIRGHLRFGIMVIHPGFSRGGARLFRFHHNAVLGVFDAEFLSYQSLE
jgi:hypothetical protein